MLLTAEPKTESTLDVGLPTSLGLFYGEEELQAEWYERRAWALETLWLPNTPGQWVVNRLVAFDENGNVTDRYSFRDTGLLKGDKLTMTISMEF